MYLSTPLSNGRIYKLQHLLHQVIRDAREVVPELHSLIEGGNNGTRSTSNGSTPTTPSTTGVDTKVESELHISLSRPVFLRAYQREGMRRAVKRLASTTGAKDTTPNRIFTHLPPGLSFAPHRFPTVSELPPNLVPDLEKRYGTELRRIGCFDVDRISVRIGKDVHSWSLGGT
ncbi:hypothetical protein BS47DRAFT_1395022 [Hydnum rufescens UP504]|uniref:Uncharacterized protein n=1 Tax=Hydnum rufescens UP504 TaxID=1448309 RepID=A0A9P6AU74_9AGAM|nr:hypothetical protein BS47DRAFT_1395022 [Hydnum rufescens UP504]